MKVIKTTTLYDLPKDWIKTVEVEMTSEEAREVMDDMPEVLADAIDEVQGKVFNAEPKSVAYLVIRVVT